MHADSDSNTFRKTVHKMKNIHILGSANPNGFRRQTRAEYDVQICAASDGSKSLVALFDLPTNIGVIADYFGDVLWNIRLLFAAHEKDPSVAYPVDIHREDRPSLQRIHARFREMVMKMDDSIIQLYRKDIPDLTPLSYPAQMIAAFYEADIRHLHIVSLGTMRGILGRARQLDGDSIIYDVHVLSADHTPTNPEEMARIARLHPGEDVIADGTLFGRPYTRALCDAMLKLSPSIQRTLQNRNIPPPDRA
ncbi:hypothetical protein C8R44DRAFT_923040 [Mycena epipterygia]|nr:hypothetical protein C8R44DRAFT_923040 [Mycena epipterygia]